MLIETRAVKENELSNYKIKVIFTPNEINFGNEKELLIKAGETEYISFISDGKRDYNWQVTSTNHLGTMVCVGTIYDNVLVNYDIGKNPEGSFIAKSNERYYIEIENKGQSDTFVNVLEEEVQTLN